ncbi:MAG: hypothetical protein KGK07_13555 [Chloroflexota bacterium]|nr:hypothetical protein [Chloroflexota bacterium]
MDIRPATDADIAEAAALFAAARRGGRFDEWGSVREQGEADAREDIATDGRDLWMVHDDAGAVRGWVRCVRTGWTADPERPGHAVEVWRFALGAFDPALSGLTFSRLYLGACRAAAEAHPDAIWEGSVVAGGALDRLWRARLGDVRTERDERGVREAYYRMPGRAFLARFP